MCGRAVVGHSQGEIAAAVVSGALSVVDGARVVALRSKAIVALAGRGGMVSVALTHEDTESLISRWDGRISVAAVNGPTSTVVSGDADALDELMVHAEESGVRVRRIEVDYASHSAHVESIQAELAELLAPVTAGEPSVPFLSTVTGSGSAPVRRTPVTGTGTCVRPYCSSRSCGAWRSPDTARSSR